MSNQSDPDRKREHTLLIGMLSLFLFASPFTHWWASGHQPWFLPYLLWLLIILLCFWLSIRYRRHDL